ncbi:MAG: hypothetical protein AB2L16_00330 [Anaerolineaceae bacterium]
MNTCLLTKSVKPQNTRLVSQLETIQEDLTRIFEYVSQLSNLSLEQLETLEIEDQVDEIHSSLRRFESRFMSNRVLTNDDEFAQMASDVTEIPSPKSTGDWNTVRREAKRANKLASQLTDSIRKIRMGLGENQDAGVIPEDILQIKQAFGNAVNDFGSDDLLVHG